MELNKEQKQGPTMQTIRLIPQQHAVRTNFFAPSQKTTERRENSMSCAIKRLRLIKNIVTYLPPAQEQNCNIC